MLKNVQENSGKTGKGEGLGYSRYRKEEEKKHRSEKRHSMSWESLRFRIAGGSLRHLLVRDEVREGGMVSYAQLRN